MSLIKLAKAQEERKLSDLDKIIKAIEERYKSMEEGDTADLKQEREVSKLRLADIKSEIKRQKINKEILQEILDMREEAEGKAMVGNDPIPVEPGAEGLPLLDALVKRR